VSNGCRGRRWVGLAVLAGAGCGGWVTAFNECNPDKGALLGRTTVEMDVRKVVVRSGEVPVGNLVVDAMYEAAAAACAGGSNPCPVAALENSGGIRSTTACGERESIPVGSIYDSDVSDLLPFVTNQVVTVEVTGEELWLMLERSVSLLGQVGESGAAGYFLQVHGVFFEVDCARTAQSLSLAQDRILNRGQRVDPAKVTVAGQPLDLGASYVVAMNSFVAGAKDGFLALAQRDADDAVVRDASGKVQTKAVQYVTLGGSRLSDADALRRLVGTRGVVAPRIEGRIRLLGSCVPSQ
jgi:2',3'-cyclic-nucleotide 2'-phosphodiesterase (5'-nucleotidase family)